MAEVENAGPAPLDLERELTCSVSEVPMRSGGGARYGGQDERVSQSMVLSAEKL